ncbi:isocitrate lyase/phosphoenolpyruvate mutase family protein [Actinomadura chibensis]|nr:isocitrate lyase/phosphoenolpyruvate mutase family protein [Actinomadura chibensis]
MARLLDQSGGLVAIGAHDALSARLGQNAGFDLIWGSGFEVSATHGVPDANVLTMSEQLRACQWMADTVRIPVIADCDNGYGNAINAAVTTRRFEAAGIAGICVEDSAFPKRCSFYEGRRALVPAAEHALKIRACKQAQRSDDFVVIARTEAFIAGLGLDEALERARAYAEAGADAVLVHSKQAAPDELVAFAQRWSLPTPLVAVPTTYDQTSAAVLHDLGYRVVIFANQGLRTAIKAVEEGLALLRGTGRAADLRDRMVPLGRVFELVGLDDLRQDEHRYLLAEDGAPGGGDLQGLPAEAPG